VAMIWGRGATRLGLATFIKAGGSRLGVRARGKSGAVCGSDSGASPTQRRPEEGDDGWEPPSATAAGACAWASLGRKPGGPKSSRRESGRRRRDRGTRPDYERWAAQQNKKRERKGFHLFLKSIKQMNSNMHLNSNTQKQCISMYATINSYNSLFN
jgi:hypothetical protein